MAGQRPLISGRKTVFWEKYNCGEKYEFVQPVVSVRIATAICWLDGNVCVDKRSHVYNYAFPFQGGSGQFPFGWAEPLCQQAVVLRVYAGETANKQ